MGIGLSALRLHLSGRAEGGARSARGPAGELANEDTDRERDQLLPTRLKPSRGRNLRAAPRSFAKTPASRAPACGAGELSSSGRREERPAAFQRGVCDFKKSRTRLTVCGISSGVFHSRTSVAFGASEAISSEVGVG